MGVARSEVGGPFRLAGPRPQPKCLEGVERAKDIAAQHQNIEVGDGSQMRRRVDRGTQGEPLEGERLNTGRFEVTQDLLGRKSHGTPLQHGEGQKMRVRHNPWVGRPQTREVGHQHRCDPGDSRLIGSRQWSEFTPRVEGQVRFEKARLKAEAFRPVRKGAWCATSTGHSIQWASMPPSSSLEIGTPPSR